MTKVTLTSHHGCEGRPDESPEGPQAQFSRYPQVQEFKSVGRSQTTEGLASSGPSEEWVTSLGENLSRERTSKGTRSGRNPHLQPGALAQKWGQRPTRLPRACALLSFRYTTLTSQLYPFRCR